VKSPRWIVLYLLTRTRLIACNSLKTQAMLAIDLLLKQVTCHG
jgi:hypothetical protein